MEIDKTTLNDLSIFNTEEEFSIFNKLNFTSTSRGKQQLRKNFSTPLPTLEQITGIQDTLRFILDRLNEWPQLITNGTVMVVENFYESNIDPIPSNPTSFNTYSYKLLHGPDYSLVKYSIGHCCDFIKGLKQLVELLFTDDSPLPLQKLLTNIQKKIDNTSLKEIYTVDKSSELGVSQLLKIAHYLRYNYKREMLELVSDFSQLDAWYGMSKAIIHYQLSFPVISKTSNPYIEARELYHILLADPVAYDIGLNDQSNFLFLTGANMAGKSTFIKSVGAAVFLAHTGMGVPAKSMKLSLFDGILSNINVVDNIVKGESYFYNEVQRIKSTIIKINDGRNWLILIDELFKGTNVQDAMKCSKTVIEGLLKIKRSLFILSTHLYEIGESLQTHPNIRFNYFETLVTDERLKFNYQLREGISNDRLGYLILKQEGVVKMLEDL